MVLPDTSAWVEYLRHADDGRASGLGELVAQDEVITCGPVVAEVLAGTGSRDRERVASTLGALPWAELGHTDWLRVGEVAAELRQRGATVPLTDVEIAVAAAGARATVWTGDSDFERIATVLDGLDLRAL